MNDTSGPPFMADSFGQPEDLTEHQRFFRELS